MRAGILLAVLAWTAPAQTSQRIYTLETVAGTLSTGDGGPATAALLGNLQGVAVDRSGNLYIADTDHHRVWKIDARGIITMVAGTGTAGFSGDGGPAAKASLNLPYGLAADPAGNIYIADLGNNRVRRVAGDGTILTIAGSGQSGPVADGGPATGAQLLSPRNLALDAAGNLYISEFAGHRIRKVSPGGQISTVAGMGKAGFTGDGGPATAAQLGYPAGLALDGSGNLYVADSQNQRIRAIAPSGLISTLIGGTTATALATPTALAVDATGTIYVADTSNMVRAYTPAGAWNNFAGTGEQGFGGDGAVAAAAELAAPHDLAVDGSGSLYIADGTRLRRVNTSGIIQTVAGDAQPQAIGDGGDATRAPLFHPSAVALDNAGNLYLAETGAHRIRRVSANGQIATFAGTGVAGEMGDYGPAAEAQLNAPMGVTVDAFGNVMVADTNNQRVRQIAPSGFITTLLATAANLSAPQGLCADHMGIFYVVDTANDRVLRVAPGAAAAVVTVGDDQLNQPSACAVDTAGDLFIADTLNNRIRRVTPMGTISTVAGTGVGGFGGDGQPATSALLNGPTGIAVTDDGDIFIADTGNNRIRLVTSDGMIATIAGSDGTSLHAPGGMALDGSGAVYFADTGSNLVRRLKPAATTSLPGISIVNSISLEAGPVAPGELVTIFGTGLGPATGVVGAAGGTAVLFDGVAAPVLYAQTGQVNVQVPYSVAQTQTTSVQVQFNGLTSGSLTLPVVAAAPALFSVAVNQDGSPNSQSAPAPANTIVTLFGTGQGLNEGLVLTVAGVPAQILFAGSAPGLAGVLEIDARLPAGFLPSGQATVTLTVGSAQSPPISIWLK
jgi:uncharacterized protein (TIGR03437 family)